MSEVQVKDLRMQSLMTVCHGMRSGHMLLIQDRWWQIL